MSYAGVAMEQSEQLAKLEAQNKELIRVLRETARLLDIALSNDQTEHTAEALSGIYAALALLNVPSRPQL